MIYFPYASVMDPFDPINNFVRSVSEPAFAYALGHASFFLLTTLIALLLIFGSYYLRNRRADVPRPFAARALRTSFFVLGSMVLIRVTYFSVVHGGVHDVLDIQVKAGIGLMIGALVCAILEKRPETEPASGGGARLRDDRQEQEPGS